MKKHLVLLLLVILSACQSIGPTATPVPPTPLSPHLKTLTDNFGLAKCSQICWHGIQLDKTTIAEAKDILSADRNVTLLDGYEGCQIVWQTKVETVIWRGEICGGTNAELTSLVTWIDLKAAAGFVDTQFTFLDAMAIFGTPTGARCWAFFPHNGSGTYTAALVFGRGIEVQFRQWQPYTGLLFDAQMPISSIRLDSYAPQRYAGSERWQGFTSDHFAYASSPQPCAVGIE